MLPFLKKSQEASVSAPPDHVIRKSDHEEDYDAMHAVAEDLLRAISAKDIKAVAEALRAGFELADSEPHVEGPHE